MQTGASPEAATSTVECRVHHGCDLLPSVCLDSRRMLRQRHFLGRPRNTIMWHEARQPRYAIGATWYTVGITIRMMSRGPR